MQSPTNKETFQLLQLSDDSKTLSDLELPEITAQRKRKVRRKTRPRPSGTHRQTEDVTSDSQCNRLIMCIALFLTSCWLLTLSYMLAVIHSESTRLEVQIKNVAITSQNVPEALQKWHETTKILEQNQTAINNKLLELQHFIEELRMRFSLYEATLSEKKDYSKDEKFVAEFGAEIKAISGDVEHFKERLEGFEMNQRNFKSDVDLLKSNFSETVLNATRRANNNETNFSDELKKSEAIVRDEIKSISSNLITINDTLSQEAKHLRMDQTGQKNQIDGLFERTNNITSHVDSIEIKWLENNKNITADFNIFRDNSTNEIQALKNITYNLKYAIDNGRCDCNKITLQSSTNFDDKNDKQENNSQTIDNAPKIDKTIAMKTLATSTNPTLPPSTTSRTLVETAASDKQKISANNATVVSNATSGAVETATAATAVEGKPKLLSIQTISKIR